MTPIELMADGLARNLGVLKMTLADFSDADMLARPAPAANHAAWQLGHLVVSENNMLKGAGAQAPALPDGFAGKFTKETARTDDPAAFPKKAEIFDAWEKTRAATVEWVKGLSEADLNKPGPERIRHMAPTMGHLVLLVPGHAMMHLGQFQVIRRALGKPVLF